VRDCGQYELKHHACQGGAKQKPGVDQPIHPLFCPILCLIRNLSGVAGDSLFL
jgi:hypothetical protein